MSGAASVVPAAFCHLASVICHPQIPIPAAFMQYPGMACLAGWSALIESPSAGIIGDRCPTLPSQ
jgi:hypothetical protein